MIIQESRYLHPELDYAEVRRVLMEAGADKDLSGELITSPHDLFSVETLRDLHGLRVGTAVPTDVFVFGKGEPSRPDCTKVGGLPSWPADRAWPKTPDGSPFLFLAQLNFADSSQLFPDLPTDVLSLLVDDQEAWLWEPDRIRFEWLPSGLQPRADLTASVIANRAGPFYGAIYRANDYPDATDKANGLDVSENWNLPILNGTKIGGLPHFIQGGEEMPGQFLCQLGSIQAAANVPYPWVNQPAPLGLKFDDTGIYGDSNSIVFGDMGTVYLYLDRSGSVRYGFECY